MTKHDLLHNLVALQKMFLEIREISMQSGVMEICDKGINLTTRIADANCKNIDKPVDTMM